MPNQFCLRFSPISATAGCSTRSPFPAMTKQPTLFDPEEDPPDALHEDRAGTAGEPSSTSPVPAPVPETALGIGALRQRPEIPPPAATGRGNGLQRGDGTCPPRNRSADRPGSRPARNVTRSLFDEIDEAPPQPPVTPPVAPPPPASPRPLSAGEKSKARDILAAIRTLHEIERDKRPTTPEERDTLARFPGFGAVALSIFPNPATGTYKDESWKTLGEELKSLLTADEYASAKQTTFNAFYTSPVVISAMHTALARLGVPDDALIVEPGCGTGNFLLAGKRYIGVEQDSISGRIARAPASRPGHPDRELRRYQTAETRRGHWQRSLRRRAARLPRAEVRPA